LTAQTCPCGKTYAVNAEGFPECSDCGVPDSVRYMIGMDPAGGPDTAVLGIADAKGALVKMQMLKTRAPKPNTIPFVGIDYSQLELRIAAGLGISEDMLYGDTSYATSSAAWGPREPWPSQDVYLDEGVGAEELVAALRTNPELLVEVRELLNAEHLSLHPPRVQTQTGRFRPTFEPDSWTQAWGRTKRDEPYKGYFHDALQRNKALQLWEEYDRATETFDWKHCRARSPDTGEAIPVFSGERGLCSQNAQRQMALLRQKAARQGIPKEVIEETKRSSARDAIQRQIIAELKAGAGT